VRTVVDVELEAGRSVEEGVGVVSRHMWSMRVGVRAEWVPIAW
jgi:hypothetical protein